MSAGSFSVPKLANVERIDVRNLRRVNQALGFFLLLFGTRTSVQSSSLTQLQTCRVVNFATRFFLFKMSQNQT